MDGGSPSTTKQMDTGAAARAALFDIEGPIKEARRLTAALELAALGAPRADLSDEDISEAMAQLAGDARRCIGVVVDRWSVAFDGYIGKAGE